MGFLGGDSSVAGLPVKEKREDISWGWLPLVVKYQRDHEVLHQISDFQHPSPDGVCERHRPGRGMRARQRRQGRTLPFKMIRTPPPRCSSTTTSRAFTKITNVGWSNWRPLIPRRSAITTTAP